MVNQQNEQLISQRNLAWIIAAMLLGLLFIVLPPIAAEQDSAYRTFTPLLAIKSHVQKRYVEEVSDRRLIDGAIRGMMGQLDPFSAYLSSQEYAVFKKKIEGGYVGIGVHLRFDPESHELIVVSPMEDSPAYQAGVRTNDVIVQIAGMSVDKLTPFEAGERLRGVEGSTAHFKVRRPSGNELISFAVPRTSIKRRSVKGHQRHPDTSWDFLIDKERKIGYIQISEFWDNTVSEFDQAIQWLRDQGVRALIVDLRFDPGGDMDVAIQMVDRFISEGTILMTKNRREVVSTWTGSPENTLPDWPVVVLVNGGSASGAEILAGTLQDHKRAAVVGERSFGKGSVQTLLELSNNQSALRLTTAYYYLPSGRCVHRRADNKDTDEWGIIPDHVVEIDDEEEIAILESWLQANVIHNGESSSEQSSIIIDRQLQRALDLLRDSLQ